MLYKELIAIISERTEIPEESVRKVLATLPDVVMECQEGETLKTPFGVFRLVRSKRRKIKSPDGTLAFSQEKLVARIRPGKRLQLVLNTSEEE